MIDNTHDNSNHINNNQNNNNNNHIYNNHNNNYKLFKLIWNNIYIRYIIINHLKLYNLYYCTRYFKTIDQLLEFKYKHYLYSVEIKEYDNKRDGDIEFKLPTNIKCINYVNSMGPVPKWLNRIEVLNSSNSNGGGSISGSGSGSGSGNRFNYYSNLFINCIGLESILLDCSNLKSKQILLFPSSTRSLHLINPFIKNSKTLHYGLERLVLSNIQQNKIQMGVLPESLIVLEIFNSTFMFPLEPEYLSTPQLKCLNVSNENGVTLTQDLTFLSSLEELDIKCEALQVNLPGSLKKLRLRTRYIQDKILPQSLESLVIDQYLNFQTPINYNQYTLPKNLVSLEIQDLTQLTDDNNKPILPSGLKKLIILGGFNKELKANQLPPSLTYLDFSLYSLTGIYNNGGEPLIEKDIFPSSLCHLDFGSKFNQGIGERVFKNNSNIKVIIMGASFNQQISSNILPPKLEELILNNYNYDQEIVDLPTSLQIIHIQNKKYKRFPIKLNSNDQKTIIHSKHSYIHYQHYPASLTSLKISSDLKDPLSLYQFDNKLNLEYLDIDNFEHSNINLYPINNNIKTIVLGYDFQQSINLSRFQRLESIIIKSYNNINNIIITTNNNNNNNFYSLKEIQIESNNINSIDNINSIFYQFIKIVNNIDNNNNIYNRYK